MKTFRNYSYLLFISVLIAISSCKKAKEEPKSSSKFNFVEIAGIEDIKNTTFLKNGNILIAGSLDEDAFVYVQNVAGKKIWSKTLGGEGYDVILDVVETLDGNLLLVGATNSSSEGVLNTDKSDGFIVKMSLDGAVLWKKVIGDDRGEKLYAVSETAAGEFILCGVKEDLAALKSYVVKIDGAGKTLWERTFGIGPYWSQAMSVKINNDGNCVVAGLCSESPVAAKKTNYNSYILLLRSDIGISISEKIYTNYTRDIFILGYDYMEVFVNLDGYSLVSYFVENSKGYSTQLLKVDFNGNETFEKRYSGLKNFFPWNAIRTSNKEYIICGQSTSEDIIGNSAIKKSKSAVLYMDENGNEIWSSYYGGDLGIQNALNINNNNGVWNVFGATGSNDKLNLRFMNYSINTDGKIIN